MRQRIRLAVPLLLLLLTLASLTGCSGVSYLYQAAHGHLSLYRREVPIAEAIAAPGTPAPVKERLQWIREIKDFARDELGMDPTENYTTYVDLKRPYVVWSLTVAEPFAVQDKRWWFPVIGALPYLGFYDEKMAKEWGGEYAKEGKDISIRGVRAYSTLGYLRDPLLSTMLYREKGEMVNLIFHETTHSHLYIKGEGSFNEQAASFIGDHGEREWIRKTYGVNSPEFSEWLNRRADRRRVGTMLRQFADELRKYYAASAESDPAKRQAGKEERFAAFRNRLKTEQWKSRGMTPQRVERFAAGFDNNAALLAQLTYEDDQQVFDLLDERMHGSVQEGLQYLIRFAGRWKEIRKSTEGTMTPQQALYRELQNPVAAR